MHGSLSRVRRYLTECLGWAAEVDPITRGCFIQAYASGWVDRKSQGDCFVVENTVVVNAVG